MGVGKTVLQGTTVSKNMLPEMPSRPVVVLQGEYNGSHASFGMDEELLSKHMLLVGGTGCGKSTLFYHMIKQLKRRMTADDVMIIFDTKGDFQNRFFQRENDYII